MSGGNRYRVRARSLTSMPEDAGDSLTGQFAWVFSFRFALIIFNTFARLDTGASKEAWTCCIFNSLQALASPACHLRNGDLRERSSEKEKTLVLLSVLD